MSQDVEKLADLIALRVVEILTSRGMLPAWENEGDREKAGESSGPTDITESGTSGLLDQKVEEIMSRATAKNRRLKQRRKRGKLSQER